VSNQIYANNMEVSCKQASGKSICAFPDVCFTPPQTPATPPGIPIPYPNTGMASDCTDGSSTVKISGQEIMLKDKSYFKKSTGDEAGCAPKKGVVNSKNTGKVYFTAWSMDVKVEGENVVRNLDMTTGNHASPLANEAIPWPYIDEVAMTADHPCVKAGYTEQVNDNCSSPPEDCNTKACCEARKCMLVPAAIDAANNKCKGCKGRDGKPKTPHHIVPVMDHYSITNVRKDLGAHRITPAEAKAAMKRGNKTYDMDKAPGICAEGKDHGVEERPGRLKKHGRIGRGCIHIRNKIPGDTYRYEQVAEPFAKITGYHTKCDPDCIQKQMDAYHTKASKGPLRKSQLAGEEKYADEAEVYDPAFDS